MEDPPTYTEATQTAFKQSMLNGDQHRNETLTVNIFSIRGKVKDDDKAKWAGHGMLEVGHKTPMDVVHNHVRYRPPPLDDDDDGYEPDWADISSSVKTIDDREEGLLHYEKVVDPVQSPWSFDITITGLGKGSTFKGTYTSRNNVQYEWKGTWYVATRVEMKVQIAPEVPKPADLGEEGSIAALVSLSPFAFKDEGEIKKGSDGAQILGDMMWQKIALYSLDPIVRRRVLDDLEPLNDFENALLKKHGKFFKRFAVHDLAERLRKMDGLGDDTKKHIFYKRHWFMKAMVCYETPTNNTDDPVEKYGFKRNNPQDMATLKELQDSYREITMACYEAGFIQFRAEWNIYIKHPGYWYKVLARYLVSETHVESWLAKLDPSRQETKEALPSQVEVMQWGNKLTLLKHALAKSDPTAAAELEKSDPETGECLGVDYVTRLLNTAAVNHYAYGQTINEDLINHLVMAQHTMDKHSNAGAQRLNGMTQETCRLLTVMKMHMLTTLRKISSPGHEFNKILTRTRNGFSPPTRANLAPGAPQPLTFGEVIYVLEKYKAERDWAREEARVTRMGLADIEKEFEPLLAMEAMFEENLTSAGLSFKQLVRNKAESMLSSFTDTVRGINFWGRVLKGMLHAGAVGLLAFELVKNGTTMDKATLWMTSLQIASIGVDWLVGKGGRFVFTRLYAVWEWGRQMSRRLVIWLSDTVIERGASFGRRFAFSTVGSLYKVLRIVGLVCTVLAIISANSDLEKAKTMSEAEARTFSIFNRIQYWLSIVEASMIGLSIFFEIVGCAGLASICGVLGVVAGAIGVIAAVIYFVAFAPDPWAWVKDWLKKEGILGGSYDESKTNKEATEPGLEVNEKDGK